VRAGSRLERASEMVGISVRTAQRWQKQGEGGQDGRMGPRRVPGNKLSEREQQEVLKIANSTEYKELSPKQIVPRLADQGQYVASESSFYRILRKQGQMTHREPSRPASQNRPEAFVATGANQVYTWDITYLRSSLKGVFFYLYMIVDIWSRKIVGWEVHEQESMEYASLLMERSCEALGVDPAGLILHSDNGGPMKGSTMLATLQWLGIVPSFSRPRVSDDNPYSEALFRTLKYRPEYPRRPFETIEEARQWVRWFVRWYNTEHLHSAIRFVTPDDRHFGREPEILENRRRVYEEARRRHPERWSGSIRNWAPVGAVWLNPQDRAQAIEQKVAA
jgi:putative transposase